MIFFRLFVYTIFLYVYVHKFFSFRCSVCESNIDHHTDDSLPVDCSLNKFSIKHYETEFDVPLNSSKNIRDSSDFSSTTSSLNNGSTHSVSNSQVLINQKSVDSDLGLSISSNIDGHKIFNSHLSGFKFGELDFSYYRSCDFHLFCYTRFVHSA